MRFFRIYGIIQWTDVNAKAKKNIHFHSSFIKQCFHYLVSVQWICIYFAEHYKIFLFINPHGYIIPLLSNSVYVSYLDRLITHIQLRDMYSLTVFCDIYSLVYLPRYLNILYIDIVYIDTRVWNTNIGQERI